MRGCLMVGAGFLLGTVLLLLWWPATPAGITTPTLSDVHITLSDRYVARLIERRVNLGVVKMTQVTVHSIPPHILVADALVGIGGVAAPLTLQTETIAQNGAIVVRVLETSVGPIPVPVEISNLLAANINASLRDLLGKNARVKIVRTTRSGLEIYADYR